MARSSAPESEAYLCRLAAYKCGEYGKRSRGVNPPETQRSCCTAYTVMVVRSAPPAKPSGLSKPVKIAVYHQYRCFLILKQ